MDDMEPELPKNHPSPSRPSSNFVIPKSEVLTDDQKRKLDTAILKMIIITIHPPAFVEKLTQLSYALNPLYVLPSVTEVEIVFLPSLYEKNRLLVYSKLAAVERGVAVSAEMWTSMDWKNYLSVTCHFIHESKHVNQVLITINYNEKWTGTQMTEYFKEIFDFYQINHKVVGIVANNLANVKRAALTNWKQNYNVCLADILNSCVGETLSRFNDLQELFKTCRIITHHFNDDLEVFEHLMETQRSLKKKPEMELKMDVPAIWTTTLNMLKQLIHYKEAITTCNSGTLNLNKLEWIVVSELLRLFEPISEVIEELLKDQYPILSMVVPLVRGLQSAIKQIKPEHELIAVLKDFLLDAFRLRLERVEENKTIAKATFLDPRFKKLAFSSPETADEAEKLILEEVTEILTQKNKQNNLLNMDTPMEQDRPSVWMEFDNVVLKTKSAPDIVKNYLELGYLERTKCPFEFWTVHQVIFPELYQLHLTYMSIPATAVPPSRIFSEKGQNRADKRRTLSNDYLDELLFLNSYLQYNSLN